MTKKLIYCLCLVIGAAAGSAYADVLYCLPKLATGFFKEDGKWQQGNFKGKRFTIKFDEDSTSVKISTDSSTYSCVRAYSGSPGAEGSLLCLSPYQNGEALLFNPVTRRYHLSNPSLHSWVVEGGDTSTIEIGTCEKF